MKLPRMLAGLSGPVTPETQKTFLRDLKHAFRERIETRAPPLTASIDKHLQSVLLPGHNGKADTKLSPALLQMTPGRAARQLYIDGKLNNIALHELVSRSSNKQDLAKIKSYACKAGINSLSRPTELSAKYAAKLLHLGHIEEVKSMIERDTTHWILVQSAHPLLVQYAARSSDGIRRARQVFDSLIENDERYLTTPLIRCLLRESVRLNSLMDVMYCLGLSKVAARGQETGLAHWLAQRGELSTAFTILKLAEPSRAKEGQVGLDIARRLMAVKDHQAASKVLSWVETRYILSLQAELKRLQQELQSDGTSIDLAESTSRVLA